MKSRTVLLVDDYADSREVLAMILNDAGYPTVEASNGLEALERAREHLPAVVVMDIFMPVMDGLTATQSLRKEPLLREIPVIAQTAQPSAVHAARDLFYAVLKKPSDPRHLLRLIAGALGEASQPAAP